VARLKLFSDGEVVATFLPDDRIELEIDAAGLPHIVYGTVGPADRVTAAGLRARETGEVTTVDLRVAGIVPILRNVAAYLRLTMPGGVMSTTPRTRGQRAVSLAALRQSSVAIHSAAQRQRPNPNKDRVRGQAAVELRRQVVQMYRELNETGIRNSRKTIAERLDFSPEHIGRILVTARQLGELGPAISGRAGEQPTPRRTKK
jgi:hypothetical protein